MGFLAWAKRLDDAAEARADRRPPWLKMNPDWSLLQTVTAAFVVSTATMLVVYVGLRLAGLPVRPFSLASPVVGVTIGAVIGRSLQRSRRR